MTSVLPYQKDKSPSSDPWGTDDTDLWEDSVGHFITEGLFFSFGNQTRSKVRKDLVRPTVPCSLPRTRGAEGTTEPVPLTK